MHSWLRNWVACQALYFTVSGAWVYYAYWCFGRFLYKPGHIPPQEAVTEQAWVSSCSTCTARLRHLHGMHAAGLAMSASLVCPRTP